MVSEKVERLSDTIRGGNGTERRGIFSGVYDDGEERKRGREARVIPLHSICIFRKRVGVCARVFPGKCAKWESLGLYV